MVNRTCLLTACLGLVLPVAVVQAQVAYTGVNLAGAEFGSGYLPGTHGTNYIYPRNVDVDYFVGKGANVIRLPFRWERLQRTLGGDFDAQEWQRLQSVVDYATAAGAHVLLDPHNQARYGDTIIGTGGVTNDHFADFWSRLSNTYKDNDKVIFGLVNEPHGVEADHWVTTANTAIAAIRDTGAKNLILVPGTAYSGAHSWNSPWYAGRPNGQAMLNIVDPGNNFAFDVHQYLDSDSSGTSADIGSVDVGVERLNVFTKWAKDNNMCGFLGEFAAANSTIGDGPGKIGDEAINLMLDHMDDNAGVWLGWTWWAAGPWWPQDYLFTAQPFNIGQANEQDRLVMSVLEPRFVGIPEPTSAALVLGGGLLLGLRRRAGK